MHQLCQRESAAVFCATYIQTGTGKAFVVSDSFRYISVLRNVQIVLLVFNHSVKGVDFFRVFEVCLNVGSRMNARSLINAGVLRLMFK